MRSQRASSVLASSALASSALAAPDGKRPTSTGPAAMMNVERRLNAHPSPTRKLLRRREQLPLTEDILWEIESGFLRSIIWDEEANVTTLGIWGPGEQVSAVLSTIQPLLVECITPARLRHVASQESDMNTLVLNRAQRTEELLYLSQLRCTQSRLRAALSWLAKRFGRTIPAGILLPLRLTHQELGDLIGSTRVTVTRLMNQLQAEGEVEVLGRQLLLRSSSHHKVC